MCFSCTYYRTCVGIGRWPSWFRGAETFLPGSQRPTVRYRTSGCGSPLAYPIGVIADLYDDAPIDDLIERARRAITAVCGPEAIRFDTRPPHMTLAYAHGEQDTDLSRNLATVVLGVASGLLSPSR
jgi:hypothetical protein